jgi:hypothetical protein
MGPANRDRNHTIRSAQLPKDEDPSRGMPAGVDSEMLPSHAGTIATNACDLWQIRVALRRSKRMVSRFFVPDAAD